MAAEIARQQIIRTACEHGWAVREGRGDQSPVVISRPGHELRLYFGRAGQVTEAWNETARRLIPPPRRREKIIAVLLAGQS